MGDGVQDAGGQGNARASGLRLAKAERAGSNAADEGA
jgi:hypothetical protein